jgi:hypothetical protein
MALNGRILMGLSALFMALLGAAASFFPQEIMAFSGAPPGGAGPLIPQIAGALYLGFAMLNWMARGNIIGGIYSRPVALGNFLHFFVVTIVLSKALIAGQRTPEIIVGAPLYAFFCVWFALVLFTGPVKSNSR